MKQDNFNSLILLIAISTQVIFSGCINELDRSDNNSQSSSTSNPSLPIESEKMPNTALTNASNLKSDKPPRMALTDYKTNLGPYNINYKLQNMNAIDIKKSGPIYYDIFKPPFNLYELELSDNQNSNIINIGIQKFTPNMERKTEPIKQDITRALSSRGYDDITIDLRSFGGHPGVLGVGRAGNYDTIFFAGYWISEHSYVSIGGNFPESVMNTFFESIRIEEK